MYTTQDVSAQGSVRAEVESSVRGRAAKSGTLSKLLAGVGIELGLFKDLAAHGASTAPELASRTRLDEKHVSEWLRAMVTARHLDYDASTDRFALPGALAEPVGSLRLEA